MLTIANGDCGRAFIPESFRVVNPFGSPVVYQFAILLSQFVGQAPRLPHQLTTASEALALQCGNTLNLLEPELTRQGGLATRRDQKPR